MRSWKLRAAFKSVPESLKARPLNKPGSAWTRILQDLWNSWSYSAGIRCTVRWSFMMNFYWVLLPQWYDYVMCAFRPWCVVVRYVMDLNSFHLISDFFHCFVHAILLDFAEVYRFHEAHERWWRRLRRRCSFSLRSNKKASNIHPIGSIWLLQINLHYSWFVWFSCR